MRKGKLMTINTLPRETKKIQPNTCGKCGLNQNTFREMFGPGLTGCELHSSICPTCHYDRNMLKDWLNGQDEDRAIKASLIVGECPECSKALKGEG